MPDFDISRNSRDEEDDAMVGEYSRLCIVMSASSEMIDFRLQSFLGYPVFVVRR
jgi:hypothetical protein